MAVINLTGTRWIFKTTPSLMQTEMTFDIETKSLNGQYSPPLLSGTKLKINSSSISVSDDGSSYTNLYSGSWNIRHRIIDFGDGVDATNQDLIDWVDNNAEEISVNFGRSKWEFKDQLPLPSNYDFNLYCRAYVIDSSGNKLDDFIYIKTTSNSLVYNNIIDELIVYEYGFWYIENYKIIALVDETITDLELYGFLKDMSSGFTPVPPYVPLPEPDNGVQSKKPEFAPYSITFFDPQTGWYNNTFSDLNMIPVERPIVQMPEKKMKVLEIPGANGVIDLSDLLTGGPLFNNRDGEFSFYILNNGLSFEEKKSKIIRCLHGKKHYMALTSELEFYYFGTFSVSFENDDSINHAKCTVGYNLNPFKSRFDSEWTENQSTGMFVWNVLELHEGERYL